MKVIDYENMREIVVKGLKDYLQRPVIRQNQNAEPPAYPFISYTITTLAGENNGTYGEYENGMQIKPVVQIWSISANSNNDMEAVLLASKAREWLDNIGTVYLNDNGVIVQSVGSITNRDNLLTIGYEYKKGFDVFFTIEDVIDGLKLNDGEIDTYKISVEGEYGD